MSAALSWVTGDDTGISSKAIWSHMMTGTASTDGLFGVGHPHDPDDFGRCFRLLRLVPAWRGRMNEMAAYGPEWKALVGAWDELTAMYGEVSDANGRHVRSAPAMYKRMHELTDAARVCVDCDTVAMSSWTTYPNGERRCHRCADEYAA